ncbi:unnamed protein product [Closterium sp. Yama58-4]|nr:unnamed protein product [Closterium sp. Yama58-4]
MAGRFFASPALPPGSPEAGYCSAPPGYVSADEPGSARIPTVSSLQDRLTAAPETASGHVSLGKASKAAESLAPSGKSGGNAEGEGGAARGEQLAEEEADKAEDAGTDEGEDGGEDRGEDRGKMDGSGERKGPGEGQKEGGVLGKSGEGGSDGGKGGSSEGEWCEALGGEVCLVACRRPQLVARSERGRGAVCVNIDDELEGRGLSRRVVHVCSSAPHKKANAALLLAAYLILRHAMPADAAHAVLRPLEPLPPFRDASNGVCTFHITALDCCQALERAEGAGLLTGFSVGEYERLEQADLTWMVPGRLLAFSTPADDPASVMEGYLTPEDYVQYFRQAGIAAIIRLNRRVYDKRRFTRHGFAFYDLYFPDGGAPSDGIVERFFAVVEGSNGPVAIHCKVPCCSLTRFSLLLLPSVPLSALLACHACCSAVPCQAPL